MSSLRSIEGSAVKARASAESCVVYRRVSSKKQGRGEADEGGGWSLAAQERRLRDYCRERKLHVDREFEEELSASKEGRRVFAKMLAHIREHKVRVLVVEKLDRLSRNHRDIADIEELVEQRGLEIHFVRDGQVLNEKSSPSTWLTNDINLSVARHHGRNLALEVGKGLDERAAAGLFTNGRPPLGYRYPKRDVGKRVKVNIELDPDVAPIIAHMFRLHATGNFTLKQLSEFAAKHGVVGRHTKRPLESTVVLEMLRNKTYTGKWIMSRGEWHAGDHPALIDEVSFERCQRMLVKRGRGSYRVRKVWHERPFTGMLACASCGASVTYYKKRNRTGERVYKYWCCRNQQCADHHCTSEEFVEEAVLRLLDQLVIPEQLIAKASAEVARRVTNGDIDLEREAQRLRESASKSKVKLERLVGLLADGEIDRDAVLAQQAKVRREADATTVKLRSVEAALSQRDSRTRATTDLLGLARRLPQLYSKGTPAEQRKILSILFETSGKQRSLWSYGDRTIKPAWRAPWGAFAGLIPSVPATRAASRPRP